MSSRASGCTSFHVASGGSVHASLVNQRKDLGNPVNKTKSRVPRVFTSEAAIFAQSTVWVLFCKPKTTTHFIARCGSHKVRGTLVLNIFKKLHMWITCVSHFRTWPYGLESWGDDTVNKESVELVYLARQAKLTCNTM